MTTDAAPSAPSGLPAFLARLGKRDGIDMGLLGAFEERLARAAAMSDAHAPPTPMTPPTEAEREALLWRAKAIEQYYATPEGAAERAEQARAFYQQMSKLCPSAREVSDDDFETQVLAYEGNFLLAEFYFAGCAHCLELAPVLEELSTRVPGLQLVKIDHAQAPRVWERYSIGGAPTLAMFAGGMLEALRVGSASIDQLADWISERRPGLRDAFYSDGQCVDGVCPLPR